MTAAETGARPYDLVLFGATGFTGKLVARYLAVAAPQTLRWAIAGRSENKLAALKTQLVELAPHCEAVGIIGAQLDAPEALWRMAAAARVLLNAAGPFLLHGEAVVRACVDAGTDYLDLSGEAGFVRQLDKSLAEDAARNGVRIVTCCGFEAVIADLGVLFTLKRLAPIDAPVKVRGYVEANGHLSGGSLQTALNAMSDLKNATLPTPHAGNQRAVRPLRPTFGKHPSLKGWVVPMQMIDQDIVLRSAAALPEYGKDFAYAHHFVFPSLLKMLAIAGSMINMALCAQWPATRRWLQDRLRQSGEGPSQAEIDAGWFKVRFDARCGDKRISTEVSGGDPGYGDTAKIFAQAGLCLAEDKALPQLAGVLTPAQAMGPALIDRLQKSGIEFRTLER